MTSQEVVQRTPQQELVARIRSEEFQSQLAIALPGGIRQERFLRGVVTALLDNADVGDPEKVEPASVYTAVLKSAQDGLVPDGREAALVIFGRKAQYLPMIGGFRKIAAESGWTIRTAVVHENDEFSVELGVEPQVRHVPVRPGADPGNPIAAYAVGAHGDGRREVEMMTVDEIEQVRAVSRAKDRGPWVDWWSRMAEKTVGRRLFAKLPLGDRERIERVLEAARMEPADAAAALYGPTARVALAPGETVDRSTGEILPAAEPTPPANGPAEDGGRPAVSPELQQTGGAAPTPTAPPVPEDDDPEPSAAEKNAASKAALVVVPAGSFSGKTLAQIAQEGEVGEDWMAWAARNPGRSSVGPKVHAALQHFRPQLFSSQDS